MNHDPQIETFVRAHGKVWKRNNVEIIRYDIDDSHFYYLADIGWVPSVTNILDEAAPVEQGLRQFWKNNSADESDQILKTAGGFGSKLHDAFEQMLDGRELNLLQDYPTLRQKKAIIKFADWFNTAKPTDFMSEQVIASTQYRFAGTLDFLGKIRRADAAEALGFTTKRAYTDFIGGEPDKIETWLIDFKTAKSFHYSHELQVAAYKQATLESLGITVDRMGLLRVPTAHKSGYEFKEVRRTIKDYMNIYKTYLNLHGGEIPRPQELESYPNKFRLLQETKETTL